MEMEGEAEAEMGEEGGSNRHGDGGAGGWRAVSFFFFSVGADSSFLLFGRSGGKEGCDTLL